MILGKISDRDYFSRPELSNSDLSLIKESYAHYLEKDKKIVTDAMVFGRAFDQYILREEEFHKNFVVLGDDFNGRTSEGKRLKAEIKASGREILDAQDWLFLNQMRDNVKLHPIASNVIENSENEGSLTGIIADVEMRMKFDILNQGYLFDVKTCQSAKEKDFKKDIANMDYHRAMAVYLEILRQNYEGIIGAGLIPVEKPTPSKFIPKGCGVNVVWLRDEDLKQGLSEAIYLIEKYKFHKANPDVYTGYIDYVELKKQRERDPKLKAMIRTIELPLWRIQE